MSHFCRDVIWYNNGENVFTNTFHKNQKKQRRTLQ